MKYHKNVPPKSSQESFDDYFISCLGNRRNKDEIYLSLFKIVWRFCFKYRTGKWIHIYFLNSKTNLYSRRETPKEPPSKSAQESFGDNYFTSCLGKSKRIKAKNSANNVSSLSSLPGHRSRAW